MIEVSYSFLKLGPIGQAPLDMVPNSETGNYRFWRAASLAKIALNIEDGRPALNAGSSNDPTIYFFDELSSPLFGARTQAVYWADRYSHQRQLTGSDINRLLEKYRIPFKKQWLPTVVLALNEKYNDLVLPPNASDPARTGVDLRRFIGLEDIDPHSRETIEGILSLP